MSFDQKEMLYTKADIIFQYQKETDIIKNKVQNLLHRGDLVVKHLKTDILNNKDAFNCQRSKYVKINDNLQLYAK